MANDYVICIAVSILACTINERPENVQEFAYLLVIFSMWWIFNTIIFVCVAVGPINSKLILCFGVYMYVTFCQQ